MAEMFKSDKEVLKEQREKREQEIRDIAEHLKKEMGFNSGTGSTMFDMKETPNGPALVARTRIDETKLPDGWKYGTYNLDGYAKEGLYRMKDGKYEFIPVEHERDKSEVAKYAGPQDVVDGLLAENPQITKDQVYFDSHTGAIQLVGVVNDNLKMPAGLKYEDGFIVDTNDYGKKYEVKRMFANDVSKHDITAGGTEAQTYGVKENLSQSAYHEDKALSKYEESNLHHSFQDYGDKVLNFKDLQDAYLRYEKNSLGEVVRKQKDGEYRDLNIEKENDPMIEARLEVAQIWVDAYMLASGGNNNEMAAFGGEETAQKFEQMIDLARGCSGLKVSQLVQAMFDRGMESKIAIYFLTDSRMVSMFGFERDLSPEMAVQKMEELKNERLKDSARNMMNSFSGNGFSIEDEMESDAPVMERKGPGQYW